MFLVLAGVSFAACSESEVEEPTLGVNTTSVSANKRGLTYEGGDVTFEVTSNVYWVINIDEEAAGELLEHLSATNYAIATLDDEELNDMWYEFVQQIRSSSSAHPLLSGYATRILNDRGKISREEMQRTLSFYSSAGNAPSDVAYWFEGFLRASGSILLLDDDLWQLVNNWICGLSKENFMELLPVIRRTFSNFSPAERRKLGEKAKSFDANGRKPRNFEDTSCNDAEASRVIPLLGLLLGVE